MEIKIYVYQIEFELRVSLAFCHKVFECDVIHTRFYSFTRKNIKHHLYVTSKDGHIFQFSPRKKRSCDNIECLLSFKQFIYIKIDRPRGLTIMLNKLQWTHRRLSAIPNIRFNIGSYIYYFSMLQFSGYCKLNKIPFPVNEDDKSSPLKSEVGQERFNLISSFSCNGSRYTCNGCGRNISLSTLSPLLLLFTIPNSSPIITFPWKWPFPLLFSLQWA